MRAAFIAPFASLVDVTVRIGQIPYVSVTSKVCILIYFHALIQTWSHIDFMFSMSRNLPSP